MQVFGWPRSLLRAGGYGAVELSPEGRARLRALSLWRESGNAKLVCSTFGVSRATLYRWRKRFAPRDLPTLQERTRRPRRVRQPTWSPELVKAVLQLREQYPPVGKGQAGGPASTRGVDNLGLDGGPHPGRSQAPATAGRAEGQGGEREAASGAAALRHAQAQGLCARLSRRPGPGGHPRAFPPCRGEVEAIHRPGHGLALGRDGGLLVRHGPLRPAVFGHPSGARSVPAAGDSGDGGSEFRAVFEARARSGRFCSLGCRPARPSSTAVWSGPTGPIRRSSTRSANSPGRWPRSTSAFASGSKSITTFDPTGPWTT